jgi:hypothetical protein
VIADNASEDRTAEIGRRLAAELDAVAYLRLSEKTLLRYFLLRLWVFDPRAAAAGETPGELRGLAACQTPRPRPTSPARSRTTTRRA